MRLFPEKFDPSVLIGPRGRQFPRREDAFQQLVGDGFRELRGGLGVHVSTTQGHDGSIDVYIEPVLNGEDRCLPELPKPLIVECKDHDVAGSDLRKNLLAGWRIVAERLKRQATAGWSGNYSLWHFARTYVYALSARLPTPQARADLRNRIVTHFDELSERPPLERIEVLDWSDLRALWDGAPRLADRWLGVGLETLLGHADQLECFTGFRTYLLEASLPFLAPPKDDPAHPDALLARLKEPGRERGLLLEGPGGVGKSRTLVEVAVRADAAGWRVLHAQAGEPPLSDEDLEATVLAGCGPTLVVLDYLDQMQIDLLRLRQRLLPSAATRGIHLALLANARPGADQPSAAREDLFDVVPLRPTVERSRLIAVRLLSTTAPHALERLGHKRLVELCGFRPIVALFIAREVERRAQEGTLDEERLASVRSGDLTGWLRRRLAESHLLAPALQSWLEPASPSPHLVAVAAILAATPQTDSALTAVGSLSLQAVGLDPRANPVEASRRLIAVLRGMGWLEERGSELAAAHDVVADEVVYDVLADRPAALIRKPELLALLAPALGSGRTLGRLAVTLRRVLGMEGMPESLGADLSAASADWLTREAVGLGQLFTTADVVEGSFALGEVVNGEPWSEAIFASWNVLATPFLDAHAEQEAARHLLYRGLSRLPEGRGSLLFPVVLRWLGWNGRSWGASFVLHALLGRKDLEPSEVRWAVGWGLAWLEPFGARLEAGFVLAPLLRREDLEPSETRWVVSRGLEWLERFNNQVKAQFVLARLSNRKDLVPGEMRGAVAQGLAWLEFFGGRVEAGFVLAPLLGREDLELSDVRGAAAHGLAWLERFGDRFEAEFVLAPLLGRKDLEPSEGRGALGHSLAWLERFGDRSEAGFVLAPLLGHEDLEPSDVRGAVGRGLEWLERFGDRSEAGFVLAPLLGHEDLEPSDVRGAAAHGLAWLERFGDRFEAEFVLAPLLGRKDLEPSEGRGAVGQSLAWLERFGDQVQSQLPIRALFGRKDLEPSEVRGAVGRGLKWLERFGDRAEAHQFLHSLLGRKDLEPSEVRGAVVLGLAWLKRFGDRVKAGLVLASLLGRADLERSEWRSTLPPYLAWMDHYADRAEAGIVLAPLLGREDLEPSEVREAVAHGLLWLERFGDRFEAGFVLAPLLGRKDLEPSEGRGAVGQSLAWLERFGDRVEAGFVLAPLLGRKDLEPSEGRGAVGQSLAWLERFGDRVEAGFVLAPLLGREDLEPSDVRGAVGRGLEWLERFGDRVETQFVLSALSGRKDLGPSEVHGTVARGLAWLERFGSRVEAGYILPAMLPLATRDEDREGVAKVCSFLEKFWNAPVLIAKNRIGFTHACYRYLDEGAWPDPKEGERLLTSFGIDRPLMSTSGRQVVPSLWDLEKEARRLATSAGPLPSPRWLDQVLAETAKPIDAGFPKAAGFLFPPLLPLAARYGTESTRERLARQVLSLFADPLFSAKGRGKLARHCYRLLDEGAWPDRNMGELTLISLGIERPDPASED